MSNKKKKILYLCPRLPFPPNYGYKIRAFNIAKTLSQYFKIDLLALIVKKCDQEALESLKKVFNHVFLFEKKPWQLTLQAFKGVLFKKWPLHISYFYFKNIQNWINHHYKKYDLIFCSTVQMAKYLENLYGFKKIIDFIDASSLYYKRRAQIKGGLAKKALFLEFKRLIAYEKKILQNFDLGFISSPFDKKIILSDEKSEKIKSKLKIIPNGVDLKNIPTHQTIKEKNWIVFLGKMLYPPNEDAALFFAKEIFPQIKKRLKNVEFLIVGRKPTKKIKALNNIPQITVTGAVPDHYIYLKQAKLIVSPLRFGAGVPNKIIEAMSLGKTVIASPISVSGIKGKNKIHFLIAKDKKAFIKYILEYFNDVEKKKIIASNAKKLIFERYNLKKINKTILRHIIQLI